MNRQTRFLLAAMLVFAAAGALRAGLVDRHSLWGDELFSLAMATGHSLEHPADRAVPELGDYVESPRPLPPSAYRAYAEHGDPAVGPGRVLRAVLLSDTSPPLYYLLLYAWTRALGTSDAALRMFSVLWSLACFPILWSLGRRLGGRRAALSALILFAFSPLSIFYSTEGRMYSLLWFLTLGSVAMTYRLHRVGARPATLVVWVLAAVCGLLSHYFFFFVWAALIAWLLVFPG